MKFKSKVGIFKYSNGGRVSDVPFAEILFQCLLFFMAFLCLLGNQKVCGQLDIILLLSAHLAIPSGRQTVRVFLSFPSQGFLMAKTHSSAVMKR